MEVESVVRRSDEGGGEVGGGVEFGGRKETCGAGGRGGAWGEASGGVSGFLRMLRGIGVGFRSGMIEALS